MFWVTASVSGIHSLRFGAVPAEAQSTCKLLALQTYRGPSARSLLFAEIYDDAQFE